MKLAGAARIGSGEPGRDRSVYPERAMHVNAGIELAGAKELCCMLGPCFSVDW